MFIKNICSITYGQKANHFMIIILPANPDFSKDILVGKVSIAVKEICLYPVDTCFTYIYI